MSELSAFITEYFDWAKRVVDALPPVSAPMLAAFNAAYAARP